MKRIFFTVLCLGLFSAFNAEAGTEYTRCLDLNYQTNEGLVKCANEEEARIMNDLNKRYGIVAGHKYFRPWNDASHSFAELKTSWLKYRDNYCNLLGYSLTHNKNMYGIVEEARCKLRETLRFQKDIEILVKNYQKTLTQPKL